MAASMLPQKVADAFVEQYYPVVKHCPEQTYKFYNESSLLGWDGFDGLVTPVTTLTGIKDNCSVEIVTSDAQSSLGGGVILVVSGVSTWNNDVKRDFNQTFFLAKQERVFFVLNDILRFSNECRELKTISVTNGDNKHDQVASSKQDQAVSFKQDQAASSAPNAVATNAVSNKSVAKNERVKQGRDLSVVKDTDSKAPVVVNTASVAKVEAAKLVSVAKVEAPKISYASMVAKVSPLTSPKAVKTVIPPSINISSTPSNVAPKALIPGNVVSKSSVSFIDVSNTHYSKVIHIANLLRDVTKNRVAEVLKKFGQVRRSADSIQLRCYEDGFTFGFVEFESANVAFCAVEAHKVQIGDKNAYITYKRRPNSGGNNGRGRSPPRDVRGYGNGESRSKQRSQSENCNGYTNGQVRDRRQNRSSRQDLERNGGYS